jgi:hypothetical protein
LAPEAKLAIVVETASMSEAELGGYCREKGLYPEQVQRWKEASCLQGGGLEGDRQKAAQKQQRDAPKMGVYTSYNTRLKIEFRLK